MHAEADERTNTLILTAPAATLKVIEDIIKTLDSNPVPASEVHAFHLAFADADETVKLLNNLLKGENAGSPLRFFFGGGGGDGSKPKINIVSDPRTNSVIVSGSAETLKTIESLLKDIDANPGIGAEIHTFQLKHATAVDASLMIDEISIRIRRNTGAMARSVYLRTRRGEGPGARRSLCRLTSGRTHSS